MQALDRHADRRPGLSTDKGRRFGPFDLVIDALGSRSPLIAEAAAPAARKSLAYGRYGRPCRGAMVPSMRVRSSSAMNGPRS